MRSTDGLLARARRRWQRSLAQAGWGAALLIGPHLLLGTWLLVVPDHLAFTTAQVVTLAHVVLALVTFPIAAVWTVVHVYRRRAQRAYAATWRPTNWILTAALIVACLTGFWATWGGDIVSPAKVHAACGIAVGIPLAVHLALASRRWAAGAVAGLLVVSTAGAAAARRFLPPAPAEAVVPAFSYAAHDTSLYEPAESCGECHVQDHEDWKRSTHAKNLQIPSVRESLEHASALRDKNLTHLGEAIEDRENPPAPELVFGACASCHAPTVFYGSEKQSLLQPTGVAAEGVGCSFCHTLREVREDHKTPLQQLDPNALSRADMPALVRRTPFFVSAPETVRRYLFQGSRSALGRRVAYWLIRWRPQVHSRDYHSPVLDDSRACLPCHSLGIDSPDVPHMTYYGWEHSPFNTGDPKTTVGCQDCHMVQHMTGKPVDESARQVPWGPVRRGARSHLFLGGNVQSALALGDADLARRQHELNVQSVSLSVSRVERVADTIDVTVSVHTDLVGHFFPALETQFRYGWIELKALDASGTVLASTPRPRDSQDFGCASPFIMGSVDDPKPGNQRQIRGRDAREFTGHIPIPAGASVDRIVADLRQFVDPTPIATASAPLPQKTN